MSKGALKQHDENVCPRDRQVKGGAQGGREWSTAEERETLDENGGGKGGGRWQVGIQADHQAASLEEAQSVGPASGNMSSSMSKEGKGASSCSHGRK